jgi:hypothetical protein
VYEFTIDTTAHAGLGEACITVRAYHTSSNGYMCVMHTFIRKETEGRIKCDAEVCNILFSGGRISRATLTYDVHRTSMYGRYTAMGQCFLN